MSEQSLKEEVSVDAGIIGSGLGNDKGRAKRERLSVGLGTSLRTCLGGGAKRRLPLFLEDVFVEVKFCLCPLFPKVW